MRWGAERDREGSGARGPATSKGDTGLGGPVGPHRLGVGALGPTAQNGAWQKRLDGAPPTARTACLLTGHKCAPETLANPLVCREHGKLRHRSMRHLPWRRAHPPPSLLPPLRLRASMDLMVTSGNPLTCLPQPQPLRRFHRAPRPYHSHTGRHRVPRQSHGMHHLLPRC